MHKASLATMITSVLFGVLCVFSVMGTSVGTTHAADKFGFGKDGSIQATKDITLGGMKNNGSGAIKREDALLDVIKGGVNRVLGIMALIALGFVLFGGVKMLTAHGEEGSYSDGIKIVQRALLGLLLIGIAWFIISAIFWLMRVAAVPADGGTASTNT